MTIGMTGSFRVLKRHHIVNHGVGLPLAPPD
jgi:hypothetical protein